MILITAFEPFNGLNTNSSLEVLKLLKDENIYPLRLPVSYKRSKSILLETINRIKPTYVISLGQAGGESKIRIEKIGINYTRASIPDNDGDFRREGAVSIDGDIAYFTNYPVEDLTDEMAKSIPTHLSLTAGGYICNTVYYTALKAMHGEALFVHLPYFKGQIEGLEPSMELETMVKAIKIVLNKLK